MSKQNELEKLEAENIKLRRENTELKEEIKILNKTGGNKKDVDFIVSRIPFKLSKTAKKIIAILYLNHKSFTVSHQTIIDNIRIDELIANRTLIVYMTALRKRLRQLAANIEIETVWGQGYRLSNDSRRWIDELMGVNNDR
jgi:DNA-binding winged helix-turn-helix (wHTH) protein